MATADPTICFSIRAHAKQQFGTSTTICLLATPPVRPSWPVGVSSRLDTQLCGGAPGSAIGDSLLERGRFPLRIPLRGQSKSFSWDFRVESGNSQETQQEDIHAR